MSRSQRHTPLQFIQEASTIQHHYQHGSHQAQVPPPTRISPSVLFRSLVQRCFDLMLLCSRSLVLLSQDTGSMDQAFEASLVVFEIVSRHPRCLRISHKPKYIAAPRPKHFGTPKTCLRYPRRRQDSSTSLVPSVCFGTRSPSLSSPCHPRSRSQSCLCTRVLCIDKSHSATFESSASRQDPSWSRYLQASVLSSD